MDTDKVIYKETTDIILKSFYEVYNEPGDGFLESVVTTQVSPFRSEEHTSELQSH